MPVPVPVSRRLRQPVPVAVPVALPVAAQAAVAAVLRLLVPVRGLWPGMRVCALAPGPPAAGSL